MLFRSSSGFSADPCWKEEKMKEHALETCTRLHGQSLVKEEFVRNE